MQSLPEEERQMVKDQDGVDLSRRDREKWIKSRRMKTYKKRTGDK